MNAPAAMVSRASRPAVRPRDSAALILLDRRGKEVRVLMGRRHEQHVAFPGVLVFPGGRVEPSDRFMNVYGALAAHTQRALLTRMKRPSPDRARALALCAIRETFEETGILVGREGFGKPATRSQLWRDFTAHEIHPAPETLHFIARAITPAYFPRRFDTRFFATDADNIVKNVDGAIGPEAELVELKWLTLADAADEKLAPITRMILHELAQRIEAGLERDIPVPFFYEKRGEWIRDLI